MRPPLPTTEPDPTPLDDLGGLIEKEHLPAGREDLAEPLVAHSQRERILIAMAESCATKGYGATTIADICEPAGVSRATFYELFKDKEDCFHASMELSLADAMGRIVEVYSPDKPWATMVRDAAADLPRPAGEPPRLRPHGAGRGAGLGRARLRAVRLGQAGAAGAARPRPRRPDRGAGDPLQRRARRPRRRRVADRRPDPRRQHRAAARSCCRTSSTSPPSPTSARTRRCASPGRPRSSCSTPEADRVARAREQGSAGGRRGGATACRRRSSPAPSASGCWRRRCASSPRRATRRPRSPT